MTGALAATEPEAGSDAAVAHALHERAKAMVRDALKDVVPVIDATTRKPIENFRAEGNMNDGGFEGSAP